MENELLRHYLDTKIEVLEDMMAETEDVEVKAWCMMRQSVFKEILEEMKDLNGGEL